MTVTYGGMEETRCHSKLTRCDGETSQTEGEASVGFFVFCFLHSVRGMRSRKVHAHECPSMGKSESLLEMNP